MTAPDTATAAAEPTLAEAFGELASGLVELEDGAAPTTSTPSDKAPGTAIVPADKNNASTSPALTKDNPATPTKPETAPDSSTSAAQADLGADKAKDETAELLAGSKPLQYVVDGAAKTFDGVHEWEGGGAVILADALPKIKDRLQQADRLVVQNRALYETAQQYERIGGMKAFSDLKSQNAVLDASGSILLKAIQDEATLITLATDPAAREQLIREVKLAAREAQMNATTAFQQETAKIAEQRQSAGQTQTAIANAVSQLARQFDGLTAADVEAVKNHALRVQSAIVRPATPDEARAAGVKVGESIIDLPTLHQFLFDRHSLRHQTVAAAKRDAEAARDNKAALAAAAPIAAGQPAAPRPGAGQPTPKRNGSKSLDQMSSAEITRAMKTGRIFDMMGADE